MSTSPTSIKNYYKTRTHNSNVVGKRHSGSNVASNMGTNKGSNGGSKGPSRASKTPKPSNQEPTVITLSNSQDESQLSAPFLPILGVSTPAQGASPYGTEETFKAPEDPAKASLFKIYFLSSTKSEAMSSAFNSLKRDMFYPRWINIDEVDEMIAQQEDPVIVLDSFDSAEFQQLSSKGMRIFSAYGLIAVNPRKPSDILEFKKYRGMHVASLCMKRVNLTFSCIKDHAVLADIKAKVCAMGGIFRTSLYRKTTHIVSSSWYSEKLILWRKLNKPVMTLEWIYRSWEKREIIDDAYKRLSEFRLPTFHGMTICVSGFDQQTRTKIRQKVTRNGGKWHSGLYLGQYGFDDETQIDPQEKTTHLVVAFKSGEKYITAMSCPDIKIVNHQWITTSLLYEVPQLENNPEYCMRDHDIEKKLKHEEREAKRRQLQKCSQTPIKPTQEDPSMLTPNVESELERLCSSSLSSDVFDGLSFYFCGLAANMQNNVKKIITRCCGTVYPELVSTVTHVLIGSQMTAKDALNLNRYEDKYRSISKVNVDWIVKCADSESLLSPYIDAKSKKLLEQITSSQNLPTDQAKELFVERALKHDFHKEMDVVEKLHKNINNAVNQNDRNTVKSGFKFGSMNALTKLKVTKPPNSQEINSPSIPVEWASQSDDFN